MDQPPELEPEDFYYEGPNLVFTAAYHLKRGSCCGSGCRHCPYGFSKTDNAESQAQAAQSTAPKAPLAPPQVAHSVPPLPED